MKNLEISDFNIDVVKGDKELKELANLLGREATLGDGKIVDLYLGNFTYEVKSESRELGQNRRKGQTLNVAYEEISTKELGTIGGPYKALENKIDLFWNWFPKSGIIIEGRPLEIVSFMEKEKKTNTLGIPFTCPNYGPRGKVYHTTGWAVGIMKLFNNNIVRIFKINDWKK